MAKVILLHPLSIDVKEAEEYGDVVYLFDRPLDANYDSVQGKIRKRLTELFDVTEDYICLAGPLASIACLSVLVGDMFGGARFLFYRSDLGEYREGTLGVPIYDGSTR